MIGSRRADRRRLRGSEAASVPPILLLCRPSCDLRQHVSAVEERIAVVGLSIA
jgi:hypothetical protein